MIKVGKLLKMLTLHLIRHAKTLVKSASGSDKDRELASKGISQSNVLGKHIRFQFIELGEIFCSNAHRTQQTCSIIAQYIGHPNKIHLDSSLYLATREQLFQFLLSQKDTTITIIGHNEGLSELATYLLDEDVELRTSEYISMTFPFSSWEMISGGTATLTYRYRPQVFLPEAVKV